mmetsp:Transcript_253/g.249  ORF Transcript_253/g.249 Transcript_253/m.249 type:complete len:151 (+) Transcript_253:527-979(+)
MSIAPNLSDVQDQEYDKLFALPKPAAYHKLKMEEYNESDKIIFEMGIRGNLRKAFRQKATLLSDVRSQLKFVVSQLVLIQNKIFSEQSKMKEFRKAVTELDSQYESIPKLLAHFKTVESDPKYSIFEMWGIKRKKLGDKEEGVVLSDFDI